MKLSVKEWVFFISAACLGALLWLQFGYGQFRFIDLSVDKRQALQKAESYLKAQGVDQAKYLKTVVFSSDDWSDRYLQKTLGSRASEAFIARHNFELFSWKVRFFKELEKEEYKVGVSPRTGEVLSFEHAIEDTAYRQPIEKELARQEAERFLRQTYGLNMQEYDFHEEAARRFDKRVDYAFSWEKKGVYVPWKQGEGGAKLLIGVTLSGNTVGGFYKYKLNIPDQFKRYKQNQIVFGEYLSSFSFILFVLLLIWAIMILIRGRHNVVARVCKKWYIALFFFFLIINFADSLNELQAVVARYPTSTGLFSYLGIYFIRVVINLLLISVSFVLPGIAGESLRSESFPAKPYSSFLHFIRSSFYTRGMAQAILMGYLLFVVFLGLQATLFYFGQEYLGVWKEWIKLTQLSSSYLPFLGAFILGASASLNEEVVFRLFGISFLKKYLKSTAAAVVLMSVIWGLGHSAYAVFPVWFRSIEVSIMGVVYGVVFVRYGLIPLLVAHYLFDVFWGVSAYVLGHSSVSLRLSSYVILILPFLFGVVSYFLNKRDVEREMVLELDRVQRYNLDILKTFVRAKKSEGASSSGVKAELIRHNWDPVLIDLAIEEAF